MEDRTPTAEATASLRALLAAQDLAGLRNLLPHQHPADAAALIDGLEPRAAWSVLDLMPLDRQAEVFAYLDHEVQAALARAVSRSRLAAIVSQMNADDRADMFNSLSEEQREALLPALSQAEREDIRRLAAYEEGTAGAIMTSDYAALSADMTATEALGTLRREAPEKETIYRAYVIDRDRRLIGSVRLIDLILAAPQMRIADIMEDNTLAVRVTDDQEFVAGQIAKYDVLALPVVDEEGRLVGIVTHDDASDVMQEEATEDFHKVGTVSGLTGSVREAGIAALYRARVLWLGALVFANIFSGAGIAAFETTIAAYTGLVFFLPLLIGSGGNAGAQTATLMVRALATGDVGLSDWWRMIGREILVAGALGLTMALAVSPIGIFRAGTEIALVVSAAMVLIVLVGSIVGVVLPFVLTRLKLDPATASAPLITTIADATGVVIYFTIATAWLGLPGN
jgi:magnesium transporter